MNARNSLKALLLYGGARSAQVADAAIAKRDAEVLHEAADVLASRGYHLPADLLLRMAKGGGQR